MTDILPFVHSKAMLGLLRTAGIAVVVLCGILPPCGALQEPAVPARVISGRVLDAVSHQPVVGAVVEVEGTELRVVSDEDGRYRIEPVPPGAQILHARRIGYAPTRQNVVIPGSGELVRDLILARNALELPDITVTADAATRARGELGTASVIASDAIRNQTAASLAGVLELVPGVTLQPPGLDAVQQIPLRSVPISAGGGLLSPTAVGPSADNLAAFGTLIILDGIPLSNNANLQSLGPRGELDFPSAAGGGIDLRRIPATTIERVEVIRGIPSARFGDLIEGAIIVDTRAGTVDPAVAVRYDARTVEGSVVGGRALGARNTGTATLDLARTRIAPGIREDEATRITAQLAHRVALGGDVEADAQAPGARLLIDTRLDLFRVLEDRPEAPQLPGLSSTGRDWGGRLSTRVRLRLGTAAQLHLAAAVERIEQHAFTQQPLLRGAMPFTDRLTPGRSVGHFVGGSYVSPVNLDGRPTNVYTRFEITTPAHALGADHTLRAGAELRREWNDGPGYQFPIEFPPQVTFNGVQGFDRPRRFDLIPPLVTSALYLDDRVAHALGGAGLEVQGGIRLDLLHRGRTWLSGVRDAVVQPRLNVEVSPRPWLRLRGGVGRVAKVPSLASLYPSPQYYDIVNVNWYANNPAERLAVLTTFILDPTNPDLGYSVTDQAEAGVGVGLGPGADLSLVAFADRTNGAVGIQAQPTFLLRDRYQLTDSAAGTGRPPGIIEPPYQTDTIPTLLDRRANNLRLRGRGLELTATLPELRPIHTRLVLLGSWVKSRLEKDDLEFASTFSDFQLNERQPRSPYWQGTTRTGERLIVTSRLIHHQPAVGFVITGTVQYTLREVRQDIGGTDTLSFAGYITRSGRLVSIPADQRSDPQYRDLRQPRSGLLVTPASAPADWLFSLQVSKTIPLEGRLSFYAFNAFDRIGRYGSLGAAPRLYDATRFGLEVSIPLMALQSGR